MSVAHILGFPRIGARREWKFALEDFWRSAQTPEDEAALHQIAHTLRARHWDLQRDAGLDYVTVGDFAGYDHVLDTLAHVGAVPARFGFDAQTFTSAQYFQMARGHATQPAMEMTKWFDTNYHYIVPEYTPDTQFGAGVTWLFDALTEAQAAGHRAKPVLLGPLTLLWLGKERDGLQDRLTLLPRLLPVYCQLLAKLRAAGADWVQLDEPIFALDLPHAWRAVVHSTYEQLALVAPQLLLTTYFGAVTEHMALLKALPVAGLHLDLARAPEQLEAFIEDWPEDKILSAGIVDGRNVWRHDLDTSLTHLQKAHSRLGDRLWVASSCSLLHVPVDLQSELENTRSAPAALDPELRSWLAFARQKLDEIVALRCALVAGRHKVSKVFDAAAQACSTRRTSTRIHHAFVARRLAELTEGDAQRNAPYEQRAWLQRERFKLPLLPTTTIGSFPQTPEIRQARADFKQGRIGHLAYLEAMRAHIRDALARQNEYGLDVLVHGEAERNDMVEYFGGLLAGFAMTTHGWVQSYGSRCVKPPLIYGDVYAPEPMTVGWTTYAQQQTDKPVKGMLTGPVTMLQWAFVRDDQPRATTALQIALALRDEVCALEEAGIGMIQIDEPALREGLPLKVGEHAAYLAWAIQAFKVASSGVANHTQIHTHMCYSEFGDILPAIAALDADVLSIETTRSNMELLTSFAAFAYPNEIGPGVYDIHSPRVPTSEEMARLIQLALEHIPAERLWVNPDCGLKTRDWAQVDEALTRMVKAAQQVRGALARAA